MCVPNAGCSGAVRGAQAPTDKQPGKLLGLTAWFSSGPLQLTMHFPEEGLVFDYRLEDAGISSTNDDEDEDEEGKQVNAGLCRGGRTGRAHWLVAVLLDE